MRCDQAVFTSVRTSMGEGYRLIAASAGLTAAEKTIIASHSPSHGGLCGADEQATAMAFYALPGGRLCAAWSGTAGREHSGRGGLRILTRAVVLDRATLSLFADDPFNVFRAMRVAGLDTPEWPQDPTLPQVELPPHREATQDRIAAALRQVGTGWLGYILQATLTHRRLILVGDADGQDVIETVLCALPRPVRAWISFACGLKFSLGRSFLLSGLTGDATGTERIIRGHPLTLVRPRVEQPSPRDETSEWQRLATDCWSRSAFDELEAFAAQSFPDCSLPALERIAYLCNEVRRARESKPAELLVLADRQLGHAAANALERRLWDELLEAIRTRLEHIWSQADPAQLAADWPRVVELARKSLQAFRYVLPLAALILQRLAGGRATADGGTPQSDGGALQTLVAEVERWPANVSSAQFRQAIETLERDGPRGNGRELSKRR